MILIGIGANLPHANGRPALETCRWAAARLDAVPGLRLRGLSRWFRTAPVPASGQPDFVNAVAHLVGWAEPHALLRILHRIEGDAGRVRLAPNAARPLDLDLIAAGEAVVNTADLILPHPRAATRAFVLAPLCDVAPGWRHPVLGRTAAELLAACDRPGAQPVQPLLVDASTIR